MDDEAWARHGLAVGKIFLGIGPSRPAAQRRVGWCPYAQKYFGFGWPMTQLCLRRAWVNILGEDTISVAKSGFVEGEMDPPLWQGTHGTAPHWLLKLPEGSLRPNCTAQYHAHRMFLRYKPQDLPPKPAIALQSV